MSSSKVPPSRMHPVDSGWAWMVLFGCFCNYVLIIGAIRSFGIVFVEFLEMFDASVSMTSLIAGLMQATYSLFSLPLMAIGLRFVSPRQSVLIGGVFAMLAYGLGSLANNVYILLFTHGILYGISFACVHGPSSYVVGQYFEKRRSLAIACLSAGGSVGGLILPSIYRSLIDAYGLRGALLLMSALMSHTLIGGMLLRPAATSDEADIQEIISNNINKDNTDQSNLNKNDPSHSPLIARFEKETTHDKNFFITISPSTPCKAEYSNENDFRKNEASSIFGHGRSHINDTKPDDGCFYGDKANADSAERFHLKRSQNNTIPTRKETTLSNTTDTCPDLLKDTTVNRQLDISTDHIRKSHLCVILKDFNVMKKPAMVIFIFFYCFGSIGSAYGHVFIAALACDIGINTSRITILVSVMSASDILGRFAFGIAVDRKWITSSNICCISVLITGIMMQFVYLFRDFWSMLTYSIIHGLFAGVMFAMTPEILIDFLGFDLFRSAMGIAIFAQGFTLTAAAPFIGFLRDTSHAYYLSFHFMGACLVAAGLVLMFKSTIIRLMCKQKKNYT